MNLIILMIAIAGIAALLYFLKKKFFRKNVERTLQVDPKSQAVYDQKKAKPDELKSLTMEEKMELSWDFLTQITELIMKKFTSSEQEQVHEAGKVMLQHGAQYQHDVNNEAKVNRQQVARSKTKKKKSSSGVSR